jgi:acetyltransferase-like isoleucine patch superfamily enzyme
MSKQIESKKNYGLRRFVNKILQVIARSSLLSGYVRARIHKLRGVHFYDVSTVFIGEDVFIDGICPSNIFIGNRCIITMGTKIITHFIDTENLSDHPDYHFRFYTGKVIIEDDVFIGMNCVIAKPVTIGRGAIIGANVVITKDVPPGSVMVGASAVNIKQVG